MIECSISGCDKETFSRTWCKMHYNRWWRHGNPIYRKHGKVDGYILTPPYTKRKVVVSGS